MHRSSRTWTSRVIALVLAATLAISAALVATEAAWSVSDQPQAVTRGNDDEASGLVRQTPRIIVHWRSPEGRVRPQILGVNQHFQHDGMSTWEKRRHRPRPEVVKGMRKAGASVVRYPGGIAANLFDWKAAIGRKRECQIDARTRPDGSYHAFGPTTYGIDENERLVKAAGAKSSIMVPFINESPSDAADWVEYMNSKAGTRANPNGGVDFADLRAANGHRKPYRVHRWEIGNEQRLRTQRYWMSQDPTKALRQYMDGDSVRRKNELLGKHCSHPNVGYRSTGKAHQVFEMLYAPVAERSTYLTIRGKTWREVANVEKAKPGRRVYGVSSGNGKVVFGSRRHGAIPPKGATVNASYTSVHKGVFRFIEAMRAVDPSIEVCASWGLQDFIDEARDRRYDCFAAHAYTHFRGEHHASWSNALTGHDWSMLGTASERRFIAKMRRSLPARTSLPITEFGTLGGDAKAFRTWGSSMTRALYLATQWVNWMDLDIPWAEGEDLIMAHQRGLFGSAGAYSFGATAVARRAVLPMLQAGGHQVKVHVSANPRRTPKLGAGSYPALKVAATRSRKGHLYLLVINRMPYGPGRVKANVVLEDFASNGRAVQWHVTSQGFASSNDHGRKPQVRLNKNHRGIRRGGFPETFPAHSITVIKIAQR